tara:strand:+ start:196 stop:540 length:345 start_codon:yes stop_codon:yes gene_type:complete
MASNSISIGDFVYSHVLYLASFLVSEIFLARNSEGSKRFEEFDFDSITWPVDENNEDLEIFEWWLVDRHFSDKLLAQGETIINYANMTFWGRTTTGQSLTMDTVIEDIYNEVHN